MLSDEQRRQIERDAAARVRAQWGEISPRAISNVVAEVRVRMQEGTWGQRPLAEQVDDLARMAQDKQAYARDEQSREQPEREPKGPALGD